MQPPVKVLQARFYVSKSGRQPVREWLLEMTREDRQTIGEDIKTLEYCWPVGMPRCRAIKDVRRMYEVRSNISDGRTARVLFLLNGGQMVLLHGFLKKSQALPQHELEVAVGRMKEVLSHVLH